MALFLRRKRELRLFFGDATLSFRAVSENNNYQSTSLGFFPFLLYFTVFIVGSFLAWKREILIVCFWQCKKKWLKTYWVGRWTVDVEGRRRINWQGKREWGLLDCITNFSLLCCRLLDAGIGHYWNWESEVKLGKRIKANVNEFGRGKTLLFFFSAMQCISFSNNLKIYCKYCI